MKTSGQKKNETPIGQEEKIKMENMKAIEPENLENITGGTPLSIPGGKRSGRKNSETMLDILNWLEDKGNSLLEDLGLKQKPVDNKIYDRRISENEYN